MITNDNLLNEQKADDNYMIDENNENFRYKTESETNIKPTMIKLKSETFTGISVSSKENIQFGTSKQIDIKLQLNNQ